MTALLAAHDGLDDWVLLSDRELNERIVARERDIRTLQAEQAADIAEADRRASYEPEHLTTTAFLKDRLGLSGGEASRRVTEARGLARHDHIRTAFENAEIDRPRVAMLLEAATASPDLFARDEKVLVDTIGGLSMRNARKAIDYWRQAADREAALQNEKHVYERRRLNISRTVDGMFRVDGWLDPDSGAIVKRALDVMVDPTFLNDEDTRTAPQARSDALTRLCNDYLAHGDTPTRGGSKPHVMVSVSVKALQGEPAEPCELEGIVITADTARRYACDGTITPVFWDGDAIVGVGRSTRKVPAALRLALEIRDGGCTWKGCDMPARFCDAHHIIHWAHFGETELDNLRLLCRRHHTRIHQLEGADPGEPEGLLEAVDETTRFEPPIDIRRNRLDPG
jgi:hypothetical protein